MLLRALRRGAPAPVRALSSVAKLDASLLTIERRAEPGEVPSKAALKGNFGKLFSDHMLLADWQRAAGWGAPKIVPYGDFACSPAMMSLHYGMQCFEGMKAYRGVDGKIRLFRPDLNMARLNGSLARLGMAPFDGPAFIECLKQLLKVDARFVPEGEGYSAYLRPTAIATDPFLGVGESQQTRLYAIISPVGPYYPDGFKPIKVYADSANVRAWPGGVGNAKVGGNYGPTIKPQLDAMAKYGAAQVLYLFGEEHRVTEVGAMNVFVLWHNEDGVRELVTAPLTYGDILPGVTRRSVLDLAKGLDVAVAEKSFTMPDVRKAAQEGRLLEVFGTGTAAVICPIRSIFYENAEVEVPTGDSIGPFATKLWDSLCAIHYGKVEHEWAVVIE
ncbi:branched-chain-amino-acid aminotransferase [Pelagophyceae sp. CCMP2097]|nr:branched-chain-amino-acid aminotransferase [Pelagophyceae sp. CCMP2097]|mmetsp:Transcript_832/g.2942  ORF Transcript_832/g.2942 Transcript_832/m.2942 type:complete len:387 (-) Transcript_832:722-1882(-)